MTGRPSCVQLPEATFPGAPQASKRQAVRAGIERLEMGLTKLRKTQGDVDVLVEQARVMSLEVEQKVSAANQFAESVSATQLSGCC